MSKFIPLLFAVVPAIASPVYDPKNILSQRSHSGGISLSATKRQNEVTNEVSVSNWIIPVSIGTPPQLFEWLPDSGSNVFSVQSTLLPPSEDGTSPRYDPYASSTAQQLQGYSYNECFGSGYCDGGVVFTDVVTVGGFTTGTMPISVVANESTPSNGVRSGTMGLNFDHNGQSTVPTRLPSYFVAIKDFLSEALWTINYDRTSGQGMIDFGFIDNSKYQRDIGYSPIVDTTTGEWNVAITAYSQTFTDVVDTGTASTTFPRAVLDGYFSQVPQSTFDSGLNTYQFSCSMELPDFTFNVGSHEGTIAGEFLNAGTVSAGSSTCYSTLGASGGNGGLWGESFIEAQFIVFDWANAQVGFADKSY